MLSHAGPNTIFKLFQDDLDYASHTSIPIEHRLKLLFLAEMHTLHVTSIMHSLTGIYITSHRDLDTMLQEFNDALSQTYFPSPNKH